MCSCFSNSRAVSGRPDAMHDGMLIDASAVAREAGIRYPVALTAGGNGRARRYPRETAEALRALRARGRSIKTSNLYLDAVKGFAAWLVQDRRMSDSPLSPLSSGNVKLDRRHDRRALPLDELR